MSASSRRTSNTPRNPSQRPPRSNSRASNKSGRSSPGSPKSKNLTPAQKAAIVADAIEAEEEAAQKHRIVSEYRQRLVKETTYTLPMIFNIRI